MLEKKNEKEKIKLRGQLKLYIQWPSVMAVLLVAMNVWVYMIDKRAGSLMVFFVLIYIIMAGSLYLRSKTVLLKDLVEFAAQYGIVQNTLLKELTVPYAILMSDGKTGCADQQVYSGAEPQYISQRGQGYNRDGCLLQGQGI